MSQAPAARPVVVAFTARSGTGKTTLIEGLIRQAEARGLKVGALKHDAHEFSLDQPGKDSHRFTAAGARTMALVSGTQLAVVKKHLQAPEVNTLIAAHFGDLDLVLVEGWKNSDLPRIEVHRPSLGHPLLCRGEHHDPHLVAVCSDQPLTLDVPVLDLERVDEVLAFICRRWNLT